MGEPSGVEDSLFVIEACRLIIKGELPKAEALAEREPGWWAGRGVGCDHLDLFSGGIPHHFCEGGQGDCQPAGQRPGCVKNGGCLVKVSCVTEAWVGEFDVVGGKFVLERAKKSGEEVPTDPLQSVQTRDPFEHAHVP